MRIAGAPLLSILLLFAALDAVSPSAQAQLALPPMRKANELLRKQLPPKINAQLEPLINPSNSRVLISLSKQRAWLMMEDQIYIDTPVSTGKAAGMTPTGSFKVLEKDPNHASSIYGQFQDRSGRVVRDGVSMKIDSAPSGTHFVGAPMRWFMRLTDSGVGMHVGILPGYPASHGCVRLPSDIAKLIYDKVKVGTPVLIVQ